MANALFDGSEYEEDPRPDLPPIKGSPKQFNWAQAVRAEKLAEVDAHIRQLQRLAETYTRKGDEDRADATGAAIRACLDRLAVLEGRTEAGFWLDRRQNSAAELLNNARPKPGNTLNG